MNRPYAESSLAAVPTLDSLVAHPEQARDLSPHVAAELLAQVAGLQPVLLGRLLTGVGHTSGQSGSEDDRLISVSEAASLLGLTEDYLYRHAHQFPFTVRPAPRQVRFSNKGIQRYIAQRQGR
jgi:predicted DNA-binding transcriptional regulator AlpA